MRTIALLAHISLDGFAARADGSLEGFPSGDENLGFVCGLTAHADTALLGRKSYQMMDGYWSTARELPDATANEKIYSDWYNTAEKTVVSATLSGDRPGTRFIAGDIAGAIALLKQQPGKDILVFGSPSLSQLLIQHRLIDVYWIFINPVLFGQGIPLFAAMNETLELQLVATHRFENGELALKYVHRR